MFFSGGKACKNNTLRTPRFSYFHFSVLNAWMAGSSPAMTGSRREPTPVAIRAPSIVSSCRKMRLTN
jgi:hypothetical protein